MSKPRVAGELRIIPLRVKGEIRAGDSLLRKIIEASRRVRVKIEAGDILVVKHKVVSKAEAAVVDLNDIRPGRSSKMWAKRYSLDARVTELALREARTVVRRERSLITETRHGFVCANSGIDVSNVDGVSMRSSFEGSRSVGGEASSSIEKQLKISVPVIICDSWGRAWREGLTESAIGVAGMKPLQDHRGQRDPHGYELKFSVDAVADELAFAAGLVCGKLSGIPACIVRGFEYQAAAGSARELLRPVARDLFR
jgi:coenzyme F420-0:L-glutamate ligase/coenzyme F420-1:gamma-L-glutamate ligase